MHFTVRSFLGHTDPNSWSQFWENEPDDPSIVATRGHLFGLVNLSLVEDEDASALGHDLINEINTQFFTTSEVDLKAWLIQTVESIAGKYLPSCSQLTLLVAVSLEQHLYLVSYNSGQMIYLRGSQISTILKSVSSQTSFIAGQPQDGDQLLLTTYPFSQGYSWEKIKNYLGLGKIQDIEESFLSELYTLPDQSHLAGALIQFHIPIATSTEPDNADESLTEEENPPAPIDLPSTPKVNLFKKIFPDRSAYVPHLETANVGRRRRLNIIFSLIVLIALGTSIVVGAQRNQKSLTESQYQTYLTQFDAKIQSANAIKNISLSDAQKLAHEADEILKKMSALKIHSTDIPTLQTKTTLLLSQTGSKEAFQPVKFFDTTLIATNAKFSQMYLFKNNLYLLDSQLGRVDKIDITNKSKQSIIISDSLKDSQAIAVDNDIVFVQKDQQVFQLSPPNLVSKIKLPSTGQIHFWNGSLYFMSNTIWKYTPNSSGFDSGAIWLKDGQTLSPNPTSLTINGQIWVASVTGVITPYSHGSKTEFNMKSGNLFTKVANLVTGPDSDILAFTDTDSIVYVYKKSGESLSSYNYGSNKILSLAFDQTSNTIFVLCADAQIYQIKL